MRAFSRHRDLDPRDAGFTLVEVIVAMFVLAIVMLAIIFVQARALTTNAESQARQAATAAANEAMEQLRAMPWFYLKKGLYSGFVTAAGGDAYVSGNTLTVGGNSYTLRVGTLGSDQDLTSPWPPLFDGSGSNKQVLSSGSGNGTSIELRSYTTADQSGTTEGVGLVVVATWTKTTDGSTQNTVLTSTAYAPTGSGCGDIKTAPFLAACQAQFESTAETGKVDVSASATTADGSTVAPLLDGSAYFQMQMTTATSSVQASSQQVTNVNAFSNFGGVLWDDNDDATAPSAYGWMSGYTQYNVTASDDTTTGAAPANPADAGGVGTSSAASLSAGSFALSAQSDDTRLALSDASVTTQCTTGLAGIIAAGTPCAHTTFGANTSGTGRMSLTIGGSKELRLASVTSSPNVSSDDAWAGRFLVLPGNSSVGCVTVSGSGCGSSGAQQRFGDIVIGDVKQTGSWDGDAASGLVIVSGYSDSVMTQRGVGFTATPASIARSASLSYWNGTDYTTESVVAGDNFTRAIPETTWDAGSATITATGVIHVTDSFETTKTSASCKGNDGCAISAGNGLITVSVTYEIEPAGSSTFTPWNLTVSTTINGSQSSTLFKEAPNA
ncbi:type IV pilus modification PilV family protein [Demequina maris]|uniref:type IV pilus modification PilV family protein n=1 Tax=Demequina maris TaxID=1638982 RepID=UPI0009E4EB86|nr:prepilin-type N-terminal cleavage/methylation domain-containing protein [Demequina maris]